MLPLMMTALLAPAAEPMDWAQSESQYLSNIRQVTTGFVRAGEGYFSPDGKKIIFQAEEKETGNPFYQIFVQDLESGSRHRVSPGVGRTTCSFFRPDGKTHHLRQRPHRSGPQEARRRPSTSGARRTPRPAVTAAIPGISIRT